MNPILTILAEEARKQPISFVTDSNFDQYQERLQKQADSIFSKSTNGRTEKEVYVDCKKGFLTEIGNILKFEAFQCELAPEKELTYDTQLIIDSNIKRIEIKTSTGHGPVFEFNTSKNLRGLNLDFFLSNKCKETEFLITSNYHEVEGGWAIKSHYIFHRDAFLYKRPGDDTKQYKYQWEVEYEEVIKLGLCVKI